jgi:ABC-type branched-subunit amino acid transport system substrate-binding protein
MKNAITLANELFGNGKYELLIQDDQCSNKESISIARKFIDQDKVKYVTGFMCNQTLIASAPVYDRAGVLVFSGSGTSGDVHSLGKNNFRFFPADLFGATRLFNFINGKMKSLAILTEQSEYSVMMDRSFKKENEKNGSPLSIQSYQFAPSDKDLRTLLLKIKSLPVDAFYINADSDTSYMNIIKQLSAIGYSKPLYTVYLAGSEIALKEAPALNNSVIFSNLPKINALFSDQGRSIFEQYTKRFGESKCGFPVVPTTLESFRVLDLLISGKISEEELRSGKKISDGILPPYSFDDGGNIQGFEFEMQHIVNGKAELLEK